MNTEASYLRKLGALIQSQNLEASSFRLKFYLGTSSSQLSPTKINKAAKAETSASLFSQLLLLIHSIGRKPSHPIRREKLSRSTFNRKYWEVPPNIRRKRKPNYLRRECLLWRKYIERRASRSWIAGRRKRLFEKSRFRSWRRGLANSVTTR